MTMQASATQTSTQMAAADPACVISGPGYRFSVLTDRLIRMEYSADDTFVDAPTQLVRCRRFPVPDVTVRELDGALEILTDSLHLRYAGGPFRPGGLSVTLRRPPLFDHRNSWRYGEASAVPGHDGNLGGTVRTLDAVDGACELGHGLFSHHGHALVDDSTSALLTPDGWVEAAPPGRHDLYLFGYGTDFRDGLRDYFHLTGTSPLLPRWALGNWWSRYHTYTADDYLQLMDRFARHGVPFSVAVLDMDWHPVDIDPALGNGWTGYTWDTELFPDPAGFLAALRDRGLASMLNVHPADGVRRHEAAYPEVARDLGLDPDSGLPVTFDITSRSFVASYLARLHHPHEALGVDSWWIDWQSETSTRIPGVDPLWMLNHVHYHDSARDGRRPLILSRYAGLGSHRYPVGFSGDTVASWDSLDFQPYFTATAANVGFFWWSHDIGGHGEGARDDEQAARWWQFGVFSPICRLHSSPSDFNSKEPWRFEPRTQNLMVRLLRLRHQLVPYLYSAMWTAHNEGIAPVRPMYHDYPNAMEAYEVDNQYLFGPDLLVAPITRPGDPRTELGSVEAWLPPGIWYDFFSGDRYDGDRMLTLYRTRDAFPVLARAGAIVPLQQDPMADISLLPSTLELRVFPGESGRCVIDEDDGRAEPSPDDRQRTPVTLSWAADGAATRVSIAVGPATGPHLRRECGIRLVLVGVEAIDSVERRLPKHNDGTATLAAEEHDLGLMVDLGTVDLTTGTELVLDGVRERPPARRQRIFELVDRAEIAFRVKDEIMTLVERHADGVLIAALHRLDLPPSLFGALLEVLAAEKA
jgi:alpha-glucosidase (family GH31 glycosyl hydrolase)